MRDVARLEGLAALAILEKHLLNSFLYNEFREWELRIQSLGY